MINLQINNITDVTADSEDSEFPVTRVLDDHVKRVYKAVDGVNEAIITATVIGTSNALVIAGTNATSISITAENPASLSWAPDSELDWATGTSWVVADITLELDAYQRSLSQAIWAELGTDLPSTVILKITCTAPDGETLQVGALSVADGVISVDDKGDQVNPNFGFAETRVDYSIDEEFSNGSSYYYSRDKVRKFDGYAKMSYDSADEILNAYELNGKSPTGWRLTDIDSNRWVVFAKFTAPPIVTYGNFKLATVSFSLTEEI